MQWAKIAVAAATFAIDQPYDYRIPSNLSLEAGMRVLVPFGVGNHRSEGMILSVREGEPEQKAKTILGVLDERPVLDADGIQLALWLRERCFCTVYTVVQSMLPTGLWYTLRDEYSILPDVGREKAYMAAGQSKYARRILELLYASGGTAELGQIRGAFGTQNPKPTLNRLVEQKILCLKTGAQRKIGDKKEKVATLVLSPAEAMAAVTKRRNSAPMRYAVTELLCGIGSAAVKEICYFTGASLSTLRSLQKSGILALEEQEVFRRVTPKYAVEARPLCLNEEQQRALEGLNALCQTGKPEAALLYGVTGSGKTQVYIKLIQNVLERGQGAMVLVPEIALTPKLLESFISYFGEQVAILHSALPSGERYDEWKRVRDGIARVVIGTRSAVFAPMQSIGLIILDEEHEGSYKSETILRYHARDVAKLRCVQHHALLLLGSATPAVETMYAATCGIYHLFRLQKRYNERAMPQVFISDMKAELQAGNGSSLSSRLRAELEQNLARGEQSILFLNRRGTSRMVSCGECGAVPTCPRCSVYLTYHAANGRLMCHHCGHSEPRPQVCPTCGGTLELIGLGTQKVQAELNALYPGVEVMRMDTDTITATQSHEVLLDRFQRKQIPILVGTQMVAKGLDFENVTLVGVIAADLSLYVDSFRAAERTFSLLTQVVGRAGRGQKPGRAVIQTWTPDNDIIRLAAKQDYDTFYQRECELRQLRHVPPFSDLFRISVSGLEESAVLRLCTALRETLEQRLRAQTEAIQVFGPAPAAVVKVNNRYRYQITLNGKNTKETRAMLAQLLRQTQADRRNRGISVTADWNPMD